MLSPPLLLLLRGREQLNIGDVDTSIRLALNDCGFESACIFKAGWGQLAEKWPGAFEILFSYTLHIEDQQAMMGAINVEGRAVAEVV